MNTCFARCRDSRSGIVHIAYRRRQARSVRERGAQQRAAPRRAKMCRGQARLAWWASESAPAPPALPGTGTDIERSLTPFQPLLRAAASCRRASQCSHDGRCSPTRKQRPQLTPLSGVQAPPGDRESGAFVHTMAASMALTHSSISAGVSAEKTKEVWRPSVKAFAAPGAGAPGALSDFIRVTGLSGWRLKVRRGPQGAQPSVFTRMSSKGTRPSGSASSGVRK
eukprot:scaffold7412_cov123-Isochrysis_galbana.AAC.9